MLVAAIWLPIVEPAPSLLLCGSSDCKNLSSMNNKYEKYTFSHLSFRMAKERYIVHTWRQETFEGLVAIKY